MFGEKAKTLLNKRMLIGRYALIIDNYNDLDERLEEGQYKIDFSTNNEYRDSIYVIYKMPDN